MKHYESNGVAYTGRSNPLPVTNSAATALAEQRAYVASTGRVELSVAGNFRVTFQNPGTSGKKFIITAIAAASSSSSLRFADIILGPTTGLPTATPGTPKNAVITAANSNNLSAAVVRWDTDATTPVGGGTRILQMAVPPTTRTVYNAGMWVVTPGVLIGINVAFAGAAEGEFSVYYYEEPL